jgi:hypothetical protein
VDSARASSGATLMRRSRVAPPMRVAALLAVLALALPGCVQVQAHGPCLRVSLYPEAATLRPGGNATAFSVRALNCGDVTLTMGDGGRCDAGNGLNLTFEAQGAIYRLGVRGGAVPLARTDPHVCGDVPAPPRSLAPGESQESRLGWNGTLMESTCFTATCAERYADAPPGDYALHARVQPAEGGPFEATGVAHLLPR